MRWIFQYLFWFQSTNFLHISFSLCEQIFFKSDIFVRHPLIVINNTDMFLLWRLIRWLICQLHEMVQLIEELLAGGVDLQQEEGDEHNGDDGWWKTGGQDRGDDRSSITLSFNNQKSSPRLLWCFQNNSRKIDMPCLDCDIGFYKYPSMFLKRNWGYWTRKGATRNYCCFWQFDFKYLTGSLAFVYVA